MKFYYFLACFCLFQFNSFSQNDAIEKISLEKKIIEFYYTNKDSAYHYSNQLLVISNSEKDWETILKTHLFISGIGLYNYDFEILEQNFIALDSVLLAYKKSINNSLKKLSYHNNILFNKARYFYRLNNYEEAKKIFLSVIDAIEKQEIETLDRDNKSLLASSYSFMAFMYTNEGQYAKAKTLYNKSIRFLETYDKDNKDLIFSVYNLLASVLNKEKNYKQSNRYFLKTFKYHRKINSLESYISSAFSIADNYINLSSIDSASHYLDIIKYSINDSPIFKPRYHELKSQIYLKQDNFNLALNELTKSLTHSNKFLEGKQDSKLAKTHSLIGNLYFKTNATKQALKHYNLALNQFENNNLINNTINLTSIFKILKPKAKALNSDNNYENTIHVVDSALSILDKIKPSFKNNSDKLFLIEEAFPLIESGLEANYKLYKKNYNSNYIKSAFFYAEKSKSTLLLESLLSSKATTFSNIPQSLLNNEQVLKTQISALEKRIQKKPTPEFKDKLFDLKNKYEALIQTIETNYKAYYNLKYNSQVLDIEATQKELKENTAILSFFYGNDAIYGIILDKNDSYFNRIEITDDLENKLREFQKQVSHPDSEISELNKNASQLYSIILASFLKKINQPNLIILTDGLLNYIPFESLIKDDNYLVNNYAISYANSATLLKELKNKKTNKNNLLAFAPEFNDAITNSNSKLNLLNLPHNIKEIQNISNHYSGSLFINKEASLKNFKTNASNFGIIHLATHAIFNDSNPEYSYLAFGNEENNLLYVADLYNLNLNANLVCLSACESGIGELKRGEGLISLARGFYFCGTQSIASTLWKINDASSSRIMSNFYKNLNNGLTKNEALQNAKLTFIKENKDNAFSHPYYWSGFVISGNTAALNKTNYLLYILLSIFLLVVIFFALRKRFFTLNF